jgi:segregation and condensation protein B
MQRCGAALMARPQLGRELHLRGMPEGLPTINRPVYELSLYELLSAYAVQHRRQHTQVLTIAAPAFHSLDEALHHLAQFVGHVPEWRELVGFLPPELRGGVLRRSAQLRQQARRAAERRTGGMSGSADQLRLLEALLFAAPAPLSEAELAERIGLEADVPGLLQELSANYTERGVNVVRLAGGWTFRTAPDLAPFLVSERPVQRKLSRAAVETLAIIAYHQPVTRAEIEAIRGVALARGTLDRLLEAGWVRPRGRRDSPGRPLTWATTPTFLAHFGLGDLTELPGIEELRQAGLLDLGPAVLSETAGEPAEAEPEPAEEEE